PSKAAEAARTVASACRRPTICRPTGSPSSVQPAGTEAAGWPVRLNGNVNGIQPRVEAGSPAISRGGAWPAANGRTATVGIRRRSKRSRNACTSRQDARIQAGGAEVGRPRDVEPVHPAVARLEVRARLARKRVPVEVVAASDHVEHERGVTDRARDGSHVGDAGEPNGEPTPLRHA